MSGMPPEERIKNGITMLEYLQAHWNSLTRICRCVQECPEAFNAKVGASVFDSVAEYLERRALEFKRSR